MVFDPNFYRTGYSIGVGAVVVNNNKALLIKRAGHPRKGDWALPGGYVEHDETIHVAIEREVWEETGIHAEVIGVIAILHRWIPDENGIYIIFLMHTDQDTLTPDITEAEEAAFFSIDELDNLPTLQWLSREVLTSVLKGKVTALPPHQVQNINERILYFSANE
jgi:ADP-ribose pyrophosphatase YjhB (NUDIX family)